jgi:hypothetical protein
MSKPLRAIVAKQTEPVRYNDQDTSMTDDELEFVSKHKVDKAADRAGNKDDIYDGSNVKPVDRKSTRHGYSSGEDAKVYEEVEALDEITLEGAKRAASFWKNKEDYRRYQLYTKLADAIAKGDRAIAAGFEAQIKALKEDSELKEKLSPSMGAGKYIKDFEKSDAPQFKGKSKEKRHNMAIAAFLSSKKGMKEEVDVSLLQLYINLDEENRAVMLNMIDEGQTEELRKFVYTITESLNADNN